MQATWGRRIKEAFAIVTIGDGVFELLSPKNHSLLWELGPKSTRKLARFFAENPAYMRLLGTSQIALGLWLALRRDLEDLLAREYGISHTTLQVDHVGDHESATQGPRFLPLGEKPRRTHLHKSPRYPASLPTRASSTAPAALDIFSRLGLCEGKPGWRFARWMLPYGA